MELLKPKDIFKARPAFALLGGEYFAKFLMYILRFNRINKIYDQIAEKDGIEFIDEVISVMEFKIEFDEKELKRIPEKGPVIVVSKKSPGQTWGSTPINQTPGVFGSHGSGTASCQTFSSGMETMAKWGLDRLR